MLGSGRSQDDGLDTERAAVIALRKYLRQCNINLQRGRDSAPSSPHLTLGNVLQTEASRETKTQKKIHRCASLLIEPVRIHSVKSPDRTAINASSFDMFRSSAEQGW